MKWYKMDCDAQENLDMRKLVDEWGWDWYGRYWAILGKIGMLVTEKNQSFALQTNDHRPFPVRLLADDLSTTVERLTNFCKYLSDNGLIDKDSWMRESLIYAPKMKERADEYTKKLLTKSRHTPDQEVDIEVDKNKNIIKDIVHREITESHFEEIWKDYPNRQGKKSASRSFFATVKSMKDLDRIRYALVNYLQSGNVNKGFIKNGSTWFNDWDSWENPTIEMMKGNSNGTTGQGGNKRHGAGGATTKFDVAQTAKRIIEERRREQGS